MRKRYAGQHLWARGYFYATVDAADVETIKKYIERQHWGDDAEGFKITAPTKLEPALQPGTLSGGFNRKPAFSRKSNLPASSR